MITSYNDLTIGKYVEILAVNKREDIDVQEKQAYTISILYDIPFEEVMHLPVSEYKAMAIASSFLREPTDNKRAICKEYNIGGMCLVPVVDFRKIDTAQYIDFQQMQSDIDSHLVELLSIMLIPRGCRYAEGYDLAEVQNVIRDNLAVSDAVALTAFFLTLCFKSIKDIRNYCKKEITKVKDKTKREELMKKLEASLQINGVG